MSKFYSLLTFLFLAVLCSQINAQTTDSCRGDFEEISSTANLLTTGFHAILWHNHEKKPEEICWNFGDNHDTCIQYDPSLSNNYFVSHTYTHTGNYNVCIRIQYQGGCISEKCRLIQIGGPDSCRVKFETLVSTANAMGKYFIAQPWHNHNKKPVLVCWNFGDSHDTCIQYSTTYADSYSVFHSYAHADNYNVCVKILYDGGCGSNYCQLVRVGEIKDSCAADFESGATSFTSLSRHFTALPWNSLNKKPVYICWNFGDNHDTCIQYSNTSTGPYSVSHSYLERGQYEVCVRIVYDGGCESKKCKVIQMGQVDSCHADFERIPTTSTNAASHVYYRALLWNNNDKKPQQICWSFGDGKDTCISYSEDYSGAYIAGHHYEHSGMYEVCVKIIYRGGCEARKCKIINIFVYNTDTCRVHLYEIASSVTSLIKAFYFVSATNNRPAHVCWSFGDGTDTCIAVEPNASEIPHIIKHAYPAPGVYRACVKVMFLNGCIASDCIEAGVRSLTDLCGGYYIDSLIDSNTYLFKAFSVHKPDDAVISYRWNFGDGSSGIGEKIDHTYHEPGVYRVCLLINTEKGCETKICNNVRMAGSTHSRLQLSPNPVINILHVLFYSTHNENVKIKIINSNGAVVKEYGELSVVGLNTWEFDVAGLLTGVYSFVVHSPNQFASGIFFKQ
jgi:PKD repeat protein